MLLRHHPSLRREGNAHLQGYVSKKLAGKKGFFGYWKEDSNPGLPDPHDFVDLNWDPQERARVVQHLKLGEVWESWRGSSHCRFQCKERMGSTCLTDGTYVWPYGFAHYVEVHGVKPPQEFIDHVLGTV